MRNIVVLDYDGYIHKSYYAGYNAEDPQDFSECFKCLRTMESFIENKADKFFQYEDYEVFKIISGHSFKKDLYPSYKAQRKSDDNLGLYREECKELEDTYVAERLEADDAIVGISECYPDTTLVFSDDKDLHKYCKWTCKLNQEAKFSKEKYSKEAQLIQMITGDPTDNIKGVPMFGEAKAKKYLDTVGYSLQSVIKLYKTQGISPDECMKNLVMVHPCAVGVLDNFYTDYDPKKTEKMILDFLEAMNEKVKEIYYGEKEGN